MDNSTFERLKSEISAYLSIKLPLDWDDWSISQRRDFLSGKTSVSGELYRRQKVVAVEIYYDMYSLAEDVTVPVPSGIIRDLNTVIKSILKTESHSVRTKLYGVKRGFHLENRNGADLKMKIQIKDVALDFDLKTA